jgi:hypothetical protein
LKRLIALAAVLLAGGLVITGPASAEKNFKWMCKPGKAHNPCMVSLKTTSVTANGGESISSPRRPKAPPVDCFYVYPTLSAQEGPNADLTLEPQFRESARQQAAMFSRTCRVFAPVYPQYTVPAIFAGQMTPEVVEKAYSGVKAAWNEYLKKYNHGRGVVLIGHSQGAGHLGNLVDDTFDRKPNLRKRLVSAVLIGGNIYVLKGKRVGGQFMNVPTCARARETGCVIASSGYLTVPPPNAIFGRVTGALIEPGIDPDKYEVMCVNPATLDGSKGVLRPLYSAEGTFGSSNFPDYGTQFVAYPDMYEGKCVRAGGAHYMRITEMTTPSDERVRISEPLGPTWGTHLSEVSDSGGNLVNVVGRQTSTYMKKIRLEKKKSRVKPK